MSSETTEQTREVPHFQGVRGILDAVSTASVPPGETRPRLSQLRTSSACWLSGRLILVPGCPLGLQEQGAHSSGRHLPAKSLSGGAKDQQTPETWRGGGKETTLKQHAG